MKDTDIDTPSPRTLFGRRRRALSWRRWCWVASLLAMFAIAHDIGWFATTAATAAETPAAHAAESAAAGAEHGGAADESHKGGHTDPVAPVLAGIAIILLLAKLGGDLFERIGLPAVLGELVVGIVLGNFALITGGISYVFTGTPTEWHSLDFLQPRFPTGATLDILARIGVVLLLFEVGLESRVHEMLAVGTSSLVVAVLGVVAPIGLGYLASHLILGEAGGWQVHLFIGATLCATSVGITARVLKDIGRSQQRESKIILGAAVIDDVLGLIVLAIVSGVIREGNVDVMNITKIIGLAFGFLAVALFLGLIQFPRSLFKAASALRGHGLLVATALIICFGFAWAANQVELAPIIGAFAAGLILEGTHYREFSRRENRTLEEALAPISALLVPIFFVEMGIQVDLGSFANPSVWALAGGITLVAVIGKQICSLGVLEKGLNRLAVGLGMILRGEVGLIFANEGRKLITPDGDAVIDSGTYSAIVVMVIITTMVTPPLLKWSLSRTPPPDAPEPVSASY